VIDFEAGTGRVGAVEHHLVLREGLAGLKGKDSPAGLAEGVRDAARFGLEMALEADVELARVVEAGGVEDGPALRFLQVGAGVAVAAGTVDAARGGGGGVRVGGVAEEAGGGDLAAHVGVVGPVETGGHGVAVLFGVPGEREFDEVAGRGAVEEGDGVVAGADGEVDGLFEDLDLAALGVELVAADAAAGDGVVAVGEAVIERRRRRGGRVLNGTAHAGLFERLDDAGVAGAAGFGRREGRGGGEEDRRRPEPGGIRTAGAHRASCYAGRGPKSRARRWRGW